MEQLLKIELTVTELNLILTTLGKLPAETSMNLILNLREQGTKQLDTGENSPE